jgi:MFS family permease
VYLRRAVFAAGFVVRPLGALLFGHVGDKTGRNKSLTMSIFVIAVATTIIGVLPGYASPKGYSIGIAAPIILASLRIVQGLALGGEYCVAVIYISELAPVKARGMFVAALMCSVNVGLIAATCFVMALNAIFNAGGWLSGSQLQARS